MEDLSRVRVTMGGVAAPIQYAGMTFAGVYQINVQVPEGVAAGDQAVSLTIAGQSSQANAVLAFQR